MNRLTKIIMGIACCTMLVGQVAAQDQDKKLPEAINPYFTLVSQQDSSPDEYGFIRRWLLLEPIPMPIKSNVVFTDSYLKEKFNTSFFPSPAAVLPKAGTTVRVGRNKLKWHALDSKLFNVKLFRFATSFNKPKYGVMFWAATIIDSPEEMHDVRLAVGSTARRLSCSRATGAW